MDLNQQQQRVEIAQFLLDVRTYIRASLETSEYENTSNMFHMTEAQSSLLLLQKCEQLLEKFADKNHNNVKNICNGTTTTLNGNDSRFNNQQPTKIMSSLNKHILKMTNGNGVGSNNVATEDDDSYLDMTAAKKISNSKEYIAFNNSADSDKTFRCSTRNAEQTISTAMLEGGNTTDEDADDDDIDADDDDNNGPQIYDICQVITQVDPDEVQKTITPEHDQTLLNDCPYRDLPAGHLAIQKSTKYGQLQRIEKRLFFDQSKKYYCGILHDWLLCYTDGPTSSRPNVTLHLKNPGIEIEHSGEGKRREVCFQITTADPSKKFIFQANNEVDAKEWIHAIEAAIRGDAFGVLKSARKLPTPPMMKRCTFTSSSGGKSEILNQTEDIYEEPSPLYHIHEPTELLISNSVDKTKSNGDCESLTTEKLNNAADIAKKYEYDVPKSPPQPIKQTGLQTELETAGLLNGIEPSIRTSTLSVPTTSSYNINNGNNNVSPQRPLTRSIEKMDFQTKIKDVHSKLSSQLLGVRSSQKKSAKKSYTATSTNEVDSTTLLTATTTTPSPPSTKEQKKQKKSAGTSSLTEQKASNPNCSISAEKAAKNWFQNRVNKATSSTRSCNSSLPSPAKCKQSEKENLLSNLEMGDNYEGSDSNPTSPILKSSSVSIGGNSSTNGGSGGKSKVNMIINQFETSGHIAMLNMEALAGNAAASFSAFCENDSNNYEPIMTLAATPPSRIMKKV